MERGGYGELRHELRWRNEYNVATDRTDAWYYANSRTPIPNKLAKKYCGKVVFFDTQQYTTYITRSDSKPPPPWTAFVGWCILGTFVSLLGSPTPAKNTVFLALRS